jgi:hypothetical protein
MGAIDMKVLDSCELIKLLRERVPELQIPRACTSLRITVSVSPREVPLIEGSMYSVEMEVDEEGKM